MSAPHRRRTLSALLGFMLSGCVRCEVTVEQPPLLSAARGQEVVLPCVLQVTAEDTIENSPVLYWLLMKENGSGSRLWSPSEAYEGRVDLLDNDKASYNKSLLLRDVQWTDSGKYLCKMSITTKKGSFRRKGNETSLVVHDAMLFSVTNHNASLLRCEVNVTQHPGLTLLIVHNSYRLDTEHQAAGGAVASLSATAPLRGDGRYECELRLRGHLITRSVFYRNPPVAGGGGGGQAGTTAAPPPVVHPQPWFLYAALLLVPLTVLLVMLSATLRYRLSARAGATDT